nr:MAG TPA: Protein of unknown function (DUF2488) [Caudoviricetes sp.]
MVFISILIPTLIPAEGGKFFSDFLKKPIDFWLVP